jgi:hypothetical protein
MNIDLVVSERYADAVVWCGQNGKDASLACPMHLADIRLRGMRKPVVKLVGEPYGGDFGQLVNEVSGRGGRFV